jgi:hypothetical protein
MKKSELCRNYLKLMSRAGWAALGKVTSDSRDRHSVVLLPFPLRLGKPNSEDPVFEVRFDHTVDYFVRQHEATGEIAVPAF